MATLLLDLCGNKLLNKTFFPPHLYIYNDLLVYKKRKLLSSKEITISYNQVSQITLQKGLFFATLEIITTGTGDILIEYLTKELADKAKKIIDQKIYHSHAKHIGGKAEDATTVDNYEKSLNRLKELVKKGQMSEKDYHIKKRNYLKDIK